MSEVKPTPIIKPTIGRRVWFRCNDSFAKEKGIYRIDDIQAMDAGIVYVHGDAMVNLIVTDHIGNTHAINSVALVGESDGNSYAMWCEWMPYQKEQVKNQEKQITLGDVKNHIQYQHEFFSDEENKYVVQLKLTDGTVVTELHSNKDHAVILAYQSASNYLQNKTNHSRKNGNDLDPTPDLPEFKHDDGGVKSFEPECDTQQCSSGSVGESTSIGRDDRLNNRENTYMLTQLLSIPDLDKGLRKKAESKLSDLIDKLN